MTTELTIDQYKKTMTSKMVNVTETAEPTVDIWPYVAQLVNKQTVLPYVWDNQMVESVYRNEQNTFDHVLLPTNKQNNFVVIIVDLMRETVTGHYLLDLNKEYGVR